MTTDSRSRCSDLRDYPSTIPSAIDLQHELQDLHVDGRVNQNSPAMPTPGTVSDGIVTTTGDSTTVKRLSCS
jgi:hypothetical protein